VNIIGAGLSGLICGALNAQSRIFEKNHSDFVSHRAVLRFREDKIAKALGLTFKKVTVRKAIWAEGREVDPSPRWANLYSYKARSAYVNNSIWNMAPSERFIAPDDLHSVLASICGNRVTWGININGGMLSELQESETPLISTIPVPLLLSLLQINSALKFDHAPIMVDRFSIPGCDLYQTIYFPEPSMRTYRATLTGELLTVEAIGDSVIPDSEHDAITNAFGFSLPFGMSPVLANHRQGFGKINPVPEGGRKALLHRLTIQHGIYSLGRFATWRNILLDDIYDDIGSIRKMITQSNYDITLGRINEG
jgi:hypothetical protein